MASGARRAAGCKRLPSRAERAAGQSPANGLVSGGRAQPFSRALGEPRNQRAETALDARLEALPRHVDRIANTPSPELLAQPRRQRRVIPPETAPGLAMHGCEIG